MPTLNLQFHSATGKTFSLSLQVNDNYFAKTAIGGKTVYHILFEHLIMGRTISLSGLARNLTTNGLEITGATIKNMVNKIQLATSKSEDLQLRIKKFHLNTRGGSPATALKTKKKGRYTRIQRAIIFRTIKHELQKGKPIQKNALHAACLQALADTGHEKNVVLRPETIDSLAKIVIEKMGKRKRFLSKDLFVKTRRRR